MAFGRVSGHDMMTRFDSLGHMRRRPAHTDLYCITLAARLIYGHETKHCRSLNVLPLAQAVPQAGRSVHKGRSPDGHDASIYYECAGCHDYKIHLMERVRFCKTE